MVRGVEIKRLGPELTDPCVWGVGRLKAILARSNETKNGGIYRKRPKWLSIQKYIVYKKLLVTERNIAKGY
jgi:hypothetical protein